MGEQPVVFTKTYDEAFALIVEARNYMRHMEPRERRSAAGSDGLKFSCEALRVTSRLTQVMAWLMMQRAVQDGEVSLDEALRDDNLLSGQEVCLSVAAAGNLDLPAGLRSLLDRSFRLYERVWRLERMVLSRSSGSFAMAAQATVH